MSLNILKNKTNALYMKNRSKNTNSKTKYIKPQFMNCCGNNDAYSLSNSNGFSINGGLRPNTYIGKQYLMSSSNGVDMYNSNSKYIKPSVVSHSSHIRRKLARNKEVVKPIDSGTNKSDNHSQGAYIERIKSCNSKIVDVNEDHKYENMYKNKDCNSECKKPYFNFVKKTKQPLSANEYIDMLKTPCIKDFVKTNGIGKTSCVVLN